MNGKQIIDSVIKLLRSKGRNFASWTDDQIISFVHVFMQRGHASFIMDGNECVGVGLIRYLPDADLHQNQLLHDPSGKIVWVESVTAENHSAFRCLLVALKDAMRKDGSTATMIGGTRIRRSNRLFLYDLEPFLNRYGLSTKD